MKNIHKTIIIFKKTIEGDIIAFMPEDSWSDGRGKQIITSYERHGQHSGAMIEFMDELEDATEQERVGLIQELERLGYNIKEGN